MSNLSLYLKKNFNIQFIPIKIIIQLKYLIYEYKCYINIKSKGE